MSPRTPRVHLLRESVRVPYRAQHADAPASKDIECGQLSTGTATPTIAYATCVTCLVRAAERCMAAANKALREGRQAPGSEARARTLRARADALRAGAGGRPAHKNGGKG